MGELFSCIPCNVIQTLCGKSSSNQSAAEVYWFLFRVQL